MVTPKTARLLIIAGSDSGGGAGIQADIKTAGSFGVFATTAIAALTAQNTEGVFGVHEVPPDFIQQQIEPVLSDIGTDAIKTGMLSSSAVIEVVAETLRRMAPKTPLVLDPVMVAKGGASLLEKQAVDALKSALLPLAALVTPNIPEAEILAGTRIASVKDMEKAANAILKLGAKAVLVKGGHLPEAGITDILATPKGIKTYKNQRIDSKDTHGTGCTLASAIASNLALGIDLEDAIEIAREYVLEAIATAPGLGKGHGPLNHMLHPPYRPTASRRKKGA